MDKKIKFANIFMNNIYEPENDNDNVNDISIADLLIQDIDLKKNYNSRYKFYIELLKIYNKNPKIIKRIYTKLNAIKDLNNKEKKLLSELNYYNSINEPNQETIRENQASVISGPDKASAPGPGPGSASASASGPAPVPGGKSIIKGGDDPLLKDYKESSFRDVLKRSFGMSNVSKLKKKIYKNDDKEEETDNKIGVFDKEIDDYNDGNKIDPSNIKKKLLEFENDPNNTFTYLELTIEDRLVFIITTFFIRYISLILIQWSVDINIIKSFEEGFFFYAVIYISIFWFIVLFVNIDNAVKIDYMNFDNFMNSIRSIFYYFYMGTNGITRLLVHSCIICVLLIVPIILNIKKKSEIEESENKDNIISYDERKKLSKSLSLFTIFIWVLTSIIATKF
jgi:hypothetical protein